MRPSAGWRVAIVVLLLALALSASLCCGAARGGSTEPLARIAAELTPGLIVQGQVRVGHENGTRLAGVEIWRRYALYPGVVIATTGPDGFYRSDFYYIPGDEMVTVWAELDGYSFEPVQYYWRHYSGYKVATLDFVATELYRCYLPLACRSISTDIGATEVP